MGTEQYKYVEWSAAEQSVSIKELLKNYQIVCNKICEITMARAAVRPRGASQSRASLIEGAEDKVKIL